MTNSRRPPSPNGCADAAHALQRRLLAGQREHSGRAHGDDERRAHEGQFLVEPPAAGGNFRRFRRLVQPELAARLEFEVLHGIGDVGLGAVDPRRLQRLIEHAPRPGRRTARRPDPPCRRAARRRTSAARPRGRRRTRSASRWRRADSAGRLSPPRRLALSGSTSALTTGSRFGGKRRSGRTAGAASQPSTRGAAAASSGAIWRVSGRFAQYLRGISLRMALGMSRPGLKMAR